MAGLADLAIELPVRQLQRPEIAADPARHFVDRQAIGGDGVPQAEEGNIVDRPLVLVVLRRNEDVAQLAEQPLDLEFRLERFRAVLPVGCGDLVVELFLGAIAHQSLLADQAVHHAHGEGAAAEAEAEDVVVLPGAVALVTLLRLGAGGLDLEIVEMRAIVAAGELVDVERVALQAEAERAAQDRKRLERGGADAVVIEGDLLGARQVERFEHPPDIGTPDLAGGIAGAIR
ncbi:hypothetical protein ES703_117020 [subsurface metagenome]